MEITESKVDYLFFICVGLLETVPYSMTTLNIIFFFENGIDAVLYPNVVHVPRKPVDELRQER